MALEPFDYLEQGLHQISNEAVIVDSGRVYLKHDNCTNLTVYTGLDATGTQLGVTLNQDEIRDYKFYVLFESSAVSNHNGQTVYANYTSTGDTCDDEMFSIIRSELIRLANIVDSQSSTSVLTISNTTPTSDTPNYSGTNVKFTTNKWLKKNQESKFKIFTDANRTVELTGTVTMGVEDEYIFTPSSPFLNSTMYYVRILNTLEAVDGSQLGTNYDFAFMTA